MIYPTMRLHVPVASTLLAFQFSLASIYSIRALTTETRTEIMTTIAVTKNLVVDPFCFRQFEQHKTYGGTIFSKSIQEFEEIVNERYKPEELKDGYASFCKHLFLINDFTGDDGRVNVLPVKDNEHLIRTEYAARNDKEVPVLQRHIPLDAVGGIEKLPKAKYLDLILYSREQIQKENESMDKDKTVEEEEETAPWGIVSIKAQDEDFELPMNPITQMR